jgi:CheY-like chemotaxis protein
MSRPLLLIVEDQPDLRKLLKVTMSLGEAEIHEAADGHAALNMARTLLPDVILLDVMMPGGLDGLEVCRRIKSDASLKKIRIIMLTARAQQSDIDSAMAAGADAYLSKPFSPLELIQTVSSLLPDFHPNRGLTL